MADEEDFLYRPILRGMCRAESLRDGSLNLYDFVLMNEALDVQDENEWRLGEYERERHGRGI